MSDHCCCNNPNKNTNETDTSSHEHHHGKQNESNLLRLLIPAIFSFVMLVTGIVLDHFISQGWFNGWKRLCFYLLAYVPIGLPVLKEAVEHIIKKDFFSEFFLMGIATIGAFAIEQYPEGVAVMLFYYIGEIFQDLALSKARNNIKSLLDQRPDKVTVLVNGNPQIIKAEEVQIGSLISLKPGEKVALDGILYSNQASFNTSALTGESKPDNMQKDEVVLAGMINLNTVSVIKTTTLYKDSKLSKILELVQNATSQKAPAELFIQKFARIYTPIIVLLAISIIIFPFFFVSDYVFKDWLYRALIFLVISCPCALVISIPLSYFGGIGAASINGILFKGSNFLDSLAKVQDVVLDKTGTLTEAVFSVQEVKLESKFNKNGILQLVNSIESNSSHPIAVALHQYIGDLDKNINLYNIEEFPGYGLKAEYQSKSLLVGNFKLLDKFNIKYNFDPKSIVYTLVAIAYDNEYVGYITISDKVKKDASQTIKELDKMGIRTTMLSGDKTSIVNYIADQIGIKNKFGDLLPEDKLNKVKQIKEGGSIVAFVGDGINDAPVVAISDIGIAMGGLGSDATIEIADVVIQNDEPSKIPTAIKIGKETKKLVWQNITLAFAVKLAVLFLGAKGVATMWEAVFADVGVALLAILNAMRIQRMKF